MIHTDKQQELEARIIGLERQAAAVQQRNIKVETDKAWETSTCRIAVICAVTYVVTALVFLVIGVKSYLLSALIPTVAY